MKKQLQLQKEFMNINLTDTQSYYSSIANVLEQNLDISIEIRVKETPKKDIISIVHKNEIVSRKKRAPKFFKHFSNMNNLLNKMLEDYNDVVNIVTAKGGC